MDNKIRKRSGHLVTFDINKIYKAIDSAFESCGRKCPATFRTIINQNQNKFKALGTVERIQDELENLLLTCGYIDIYKHFTTYRAERAEQRERLKRKDLMSIVNVEVNDITTDNANMAAQTPAGMMMKFAGELSKPFANQELIAPEFVKAMDDNYIYLHDRDYLATRSFTCASEDSHITLRDENGDVHHTQMKHLDNFLDGYVDGSGMTPLNANLWIQGRNGWTKITAVSRRDLAPGEPLYSFNTRKGLPLKVTGNHQVPVIRDEHEVLLLAEDIKVGDVLLSPVVFDHTLIDGGYENAVYDYVKIESIDKTTSDTIKVYDIETGEHWFVTNDYIVHNCVQTPLDKLLKGGLFAGHGEIRPAKRIETAVVVAVISLQTTQNEMHGGQAIPAFDFYMAPYVHLTYLEEVEKLGETLEWTPEQLEYYKGLDIKEYTEEGQVDKYARIAVKRTINRTHQAMESFIHNCNNIHSRGGNQVVFSSINYGTDTSPEGRLVIRELLNCTLDGVGNGATAIFPIHVFKCKAGVNKNPGDPNYDLYKLSWPVTARRFFPNYLNLDASFNCDPNWKADDPKRYEHEVATMGALAGVEHLYVKIDGGEPMDISIKDFYEYCKTGELKNVRPCQMWFNEGVSYNPTERRELTYTNVRGDSGVYAITYIPEDITYIGSTGNLRRRLREHRCNINRYGKIDGGMVTGDNDLNNYKFDVLEYTEDYKNAEKKYIETIPNSNVRGTSNKYYRLNNVKNLIETRPNLPGDLKTPQDLIDLQDRDIKVYDRDGKWTKVLHVFKNDAKNTPQMMHIFYSEHDKEYCLRCTEDHPLWNGHTYKPASTLEVGEHLYRADGLELTITRIGWLTTRADSYDIGTATGTFIGSDIIMHNCRTRTYSNRFGQPTSIGRGNLSFTSINLPKLAIEVAIETGFYVPTEGGYKINPDCKVPLEERIKMFKAKLKSTADLVAKQLDDRYKFQKQALKNQFPLLMSGVWLDSEKLKSGQTVESVIKHGTLGVSFIGLAETLIMLTGKHHGESDDAQAVGLDIISYLSSLCDGYSDEYDHNYSCFATPAEGLSGRFVVVDRKVYGNIEHVTDKDYYTNSSHVPVWYQCTPQHKAEIEGPYHKYEPGGHIFYVEADADITKNPEYVDAINRMAWANDCGYSSINHTQGRCEDCNFESNDPDLHRFGSTCPHCGGHWSTLDRVTGYLSSTYNKQAFGKKAEILDRVVHAHTTK